MGCARTEWTRAQQRRQWAATRAAALAVGCCGGGGTAGSGLGGTRKRGRAQVTKLGARWRAGHGNGGARALAVKWLKTGEAQARMQGTGGLRGVCSECMEMYGPSLLFL